MPRCDVKWKLAGIFAGISNGCIVYAEAKYCAFEIGGGQKYYACASAEYCCNFGCCVSPGFPIYHLWYYWLLVIIMFLVCSGGGWWYRYWLQGRYRAAASAIPSRTTTMRTQNPLRGPTCQAQQARITYNSARNTVLLHRMWKGPHRSVTSPAYNGAAASSTHFQNTSVVLNENTCPYYQLYGPPPSYETVIAQTRGKVSNPTSPENSRTSLQTPPVQSRSMPPCYAHPYGMAPRRNDNMDSAHTSNRGINSRQLDGYDTPGYPHYASASQPNGSTTARHDVCVPMEFSEDCAPSIGNTLRIHQGSLKRFIKPTEMSLSQDNNNTNIERFGILSINCASGSGEHAFRDLSNLSQDRIQEQEVPETFRLPTETYSVVATRLMYPKRVEQRYGKRNQEDDDSARDRSSSPGTSGLSNRDKDKRHSPDGGVFTRDPDPIGSNQDTGNVIREGTSPSQSSPSNNVILAPLTCNLTNDISSPSALASNNVNNQVGLRSPSDFARRFASSFESKPKLDRSKSLD
ncbi:uncharacterized protein LOC107264509 isoform X2 [Cephus cinctus]|uniref:Uncharacterized protein LOC107264509 isoform X2 n=1 Tax=Cephus cinctus TaxID=211228 RepID=A0AAJ7BKG1_CEPCN|nr:uncharacterized protein LOC107264509 isoform X2 [Cephus cinctus]